MDVRPLIRIGSLIVLYRRIPRLLPHTTRFARSALRFVLILMLPYALYSTVRGFTEWSPNLPGWKLTKMLMGGIASFLLFALGAVVLLIDAKREQ